MSDNAHATRAGYDAGTAFRALVDGFTAFARGWNAALYGIPVSESPHVEPGTAIIGDDHVFLSARETIRSRHPEGLDGTIAASLEWQRLLIAHAVKAANDRIDALAGGTK